MSEYMTPEQAWAELQASLATRTYDYLYDLARRALETLAADTLEYGVEDANGDIEWFPVDATFGTAEDARLAAVNFAASDALFRLVARRVSAPWEATDE